MTEMERAASAYRAFRRREPGCPEELDFLLDSFRVPGAHAELLRSLDRTDPHAAERLAEALAGLPTAGGRLPRIPPLRRAGPGGVRPGLPRPAGRPGRPAGGAEGLGRRGGRVARAGPVAAHQRRTDLLGPPPRAAPGGLHALPRRDHPGRHARRAEEPGLAAEVRGGPPQLAALPEDRGGDRAEPRDRGCSRRRGGRTGPPAVRRAVSRESSIRLWQNPLPRSSRGCAGWAMSRRFSGWPRGWPTGSPTPTSGASSTAT